MQYIDTLKKQSLWDKIREMQKIQIMIRLNTFAQIEKKVFIIDSTRVVFSKLEWLLVTT